MVSVPGLGKGVRIPGDKVWKVRRSHIQQARREREIDNGKNLLDKNQITNKFADLSGIIMGSRATGSRMTLDEIMARGSRGSSSSSSTPTPTPMPANDSAESQSQHYGSLLKLVTMEKALPTPNSEVEPTIATGPKVTPKKRARAAARTTDLDSPGTAAKVANPEDSIFIRI